MPTTTFLKNILVNRDFSLEIINGKHARDLFDLVEKNREHLRKWLPWVDSMQSLQSAEAYISLCNRQHSEGTDHGYMILFQGQPVGRIGIHYIHKHNRSGAIGYWLSKEYAGKGIITKACRALIHQAFEHLDLHRIEIKCATGNMKSAAIAERLHFHREGILRQAEYINGQFHDLYLYAMLRDDWRKQLQVTGMSV